MSAIAECPVCTTPAGRVPVCPGCDWQLFGGPFVGWASPESLRAWKDRLTEAASQWDVAAAVRCGATAEDAAELDLRGGRPTAHAWERAVTQSLPRTQDEPVALPADVDAVLERLVSGQQPAATFVLCSRDGIAIKPVTVDDAGFFQSSPATELGWPAEELPAHRMQRLFTLAGGIGARPADRQAFDAAVERALPELGGGETVVVVRDHGWVLVDRAREIVRRHAVVAATIVDASEHTLDDLVGALLDALPIPYDYAALVHGIDSGTGTVKVTAVPLFARGSRAASDDSPTTSAITLRGDPQDERSVVVPVVARIGDDPDGWRPLTFAQTTLAPRAEVTLEVTLAGPAVLRYARPDHAPVTPLAGFDVGAVLRAGARDVPQIRPLDLVFAVELAGTDEDVAKRLDFVRRVTQLIERQHPQRGRVRFGGLGYVDHSDRPTALYASNQVVLGDGEPTSAEEFLAQTSNWRPHAPLRDGATAMEDALAKAAGLRWQPPAAADRALVLVGRRPPAESRRRGPVPACPHRLDWRDALRRLRARQVQVFGVRDVVDVPTALSSETTVLRNHAASAWREIAAGRLIPAGRKAAEDISAAVVNWPALAPDAFPLAFSPGVFADEHTLPHSTLETIKT